MTCVYTHKHTLRHCLVLIQLASNACTEGYPLCKLILFKRPRVYWRTNFIPLAVSSIRILPCGYYLAVGGVFACINARVCFLADDALVRKGHPLLRIYTGVCGMLFLRLSQLDAQRPRSPRG